jgi:NAD(P)-dependent dehydrogenase (short-subunit alcohol dehydrogenase family)
VAAAAEALGGLEVLIYAASGPFEPAAPQDIDLRDWQASFDVVARGFFLSACAAREHFVAGASRMGGTASAERTAARSTTGRIAATRGVIVALTDVLGAAPSAAFAGHSAAKAAQIALVTSLAKAWASDGVRVCGVAPGPIDLPDDPRREATTRAAARSATGRLVAPGEIAQAVRFVIACDALTGVNLPVDGGALLGRSAP